MPTTSTPSRRPLRRRTLTVGALGLFLGGLVFGLSIEALAGESAADDRVRQAEARVEAMQRAQDRANADDLAFLAAQFDGLRDAGSIPSERAEVWGRLADCESGDWSNGTPIDGTRRWDYGLTFDHGDFFEGGLNFHPGTWDAFRDADMPDHAGRATAEQQMIVAERVLAEQGWGAWPVCSRKIGLR